MTYVGLLLVRIDLTHNKKPWAEYLIIFEYGG